jgi:hypothetical protein
MNFKYNIIMNFSRKLENSRLDKCYQVTALIRCSVDDNTIKLLGRSIMSKGVTIGVERTVRDNFNVSSYKLVCSEKNKLRLTESILKELE